MLEQFVEVACLHHLAILRAAVVGGFPAGGLRRDRSATMTVPLLTLTVLIVAFGADPAAGDIG